MNFCDYCRCFSDNVKSQWALVKDSAQLHVCPECMGKYEAKLNPIAKCHYCGEKTEIRPLDLPGVGITYSVCFNEKCRTEHQKEVDLRNNTYANSMRIKAELRDAEFKRTHHYNDVYNMWFPN